DSLLEQRLGFLDAVEHGVHVGREEPRHPVYESHFVHLLVRVVRQCAAETSVGGRRARLKAAKRKLFGRAFTKDLHAGGGRAASLRKRGNVSRTPMEEQKSRILVVEDEAAIRNGLTDVLVYHGYRVDAVGDGREGLAKALSGRYDLVLLDVMLPGR